MPNDDVEQTDSRQEDQTDPSVAEESAPPRKFFTRRNLVIFFGGLAILLVLLAALAVVFYKTGAGDSYVKAQFRDKMQEIGIDFDADVFRVTVNPLQLELRNATFNDHISGEKLFFVRDARLGLTVDNLFAWQLSRDISIRTTEINGAEAWIKFDENGRSNFSNLKLVEEEGGGAVNFKYETIDLALRDSVIHFGDVSRKIDADANNVMFFLQPILDETAEGDRRFKFDLASNDSRFVYDGDELRPIDLKANGTADPNGLEVSELKLTTPISESTLSGTIDDWTELKYNLNIRSNVDLTQASNIFSIGTALRGVGNFEGTVGGQGEKYNIDGKITSESLAADGVYLRGVNIAATVAGTNSNYEADGTAVAELFTFEDFRVEFPKITGNVRGTGTDFRWVGELEAIAARSKSLTLGGLFLSDAAAEYKEKELRASAVNGRAKKFSVAENEFANLVARDMRFSLIDGRIVLTSPNATADSFTTDDYKLNGIKGSGVNVTNQQKTTDITVNSLRADNAQVKDTRLNNVTANDFKFKDLPNSVELSAKNVRAQELRGDGVRIDGLESPEITLADNKDETVIYSDRVRLAKLDTDAATLGTLNIAGVRLTIKQGRVEVRSKDIDAGTVALNRSAALPDGGSLENVSIAAPVFVLEPSGRYRATADMSIGGGIVGSVPLGNAHAKVEVTEAHADLSELTANVMDGTLAGNALIAFSERGESNINAGFSGLDLSKLIALQGGRVIPLEGRTSGDVALTMRGTNYKTMSGTVNADVTADAGDPTAEQIPIRGSVRLTAQEGLFDVDLAKLNTDKSELTATGRFDIGGEDSDLDVLLASSDASEIERLIRISGVSPAFEEQFDRLNLAVAGDLKFDGNITGDLSDPIIDATASLAEVRIRDRRIGEVTTELHRDASMLALTNGKLNEIAGGSIDFSVEVPTYGANNITVNATLNGVNAGNLLSALPVELPGGLSDFTGTTSGTVELRGLPNESTGTIDIASTDGTISGQPFDSLTAKAVFADTVIQLQNAEIKAGEGFASARGSYDYETTAFDLDITTENLPLSLVASALPKNEFIRDVSGRVDMTAKAIGTADRTSSFDIKFNGTAGEVVVNESQLGNIEFNGTTMNSQLTAALTAMLDGQPQVINATLNFADERMPFTITNRLENGSLRPLIALIPQLQGIDIGGNATGDIEFGGRLRSRDANDELVFSTADLSGSLRLSALSLSLEGTPLTATEPVVVLFDSNSVVFQSARLSGGGSNLTIAGTKALTDEGVNNLSVDGRVNLSLLNVIPGIAGSDTFFGGFADVSMRLAGVNRSARVSGTANIQNASLAAFIGSQRLTFDRLDGRILFTSNQVQIERASGYLGGGKFTATGGALLSDSLGIDSFRLNINGSNVTVPLPEDFITTGDVRLEISGRQIGGGLSTLVAGQILARRSLYTQDIDLANIVGARSEGSLSGGGSSSLRAPRFDLTIEGRDALIVRNNIADMTASVSLRLTGNTNNPVLSGRITASSGTVFFRKERYDVQRLTVEFPPNTQIDPIIALQAESEIAGYQVYVNVSGSLSDTETLNASVRSSPALPEADVVSLITTGSLTNSESGLPTLAQSGINTAAEVITDSIINNPARKATDKLFGLNVFEIDPIISGTRSNPTARLTVGRQINNNLRVTYATNLSQDQNQIVALEYRVSNKLSVVAQYEQSPLTNITGNRNNFSIEFRFRKRF